MKRRVRAAWLALLLGVASAAALCLLPARWVMAWVPESSPVLVIDASGTLWNASATIAVGVGGLRRTLPDPLRWRVSFNGRPHLVLTHPWVRGPLTLALSLQGLRVSAQSLQLPASALSTVHGIFNALDPGGDVFLSWPELVLGKGTVASLDSTRLLSAQWRNASSSLTRVAPFGDYTLILSQGANDIIALTLATNQGPWMMEGSGTLPKSGSVQFDGKAWIHESANSETHAALQRLLDAIGPRSGPSGHTIMKIR